MVLMLAEQTAPRLSLREAYAHCKRIALGRQENFPVVTWFLPKRLRPHLYAIYAYCRGVDDLGDESEGDRFALLDEWQEELKRAYLGGATDPRFVALAHTIKWFNIPPEPFDRLIEANRRDQRVQRYATFDDLLDYCTYSADPVGRLVLYVFGYRDEERQALADFTSTALQLANFWQDVSLDAQKGRIYIPTDDIEAFGVDEADILARRCTRSFQRLIEFQVERTRDYFRRGLPLVGKVSGHLRVDLKAFTLGGLAVLDAIAAHKYDVLSQRPSPSLLQKAALLPRAVAPLPISPAPRR